VLLRRAIADLVDFCNGDFRKRFVVWKALSLGHSGVLGVCCGDARAYVLRSIVCLGEIRLDC